MSKPPPRPPQKPSSGDDWNPYTKEPGAARPRRAKEPPKDNTAKVLLIVFGTIGLGLVVVCGVVGYMVSQTAQRVRRNIANTVNQYELLPTNNVEEHQQFAQEFRDFHRRAVEETGFDDIDPKARQKVEAAIAELAVIVEADDDEKFSQIFDERLFARRARKSSQMSDLGRLMFSRFEDKAVDGSAFTDVFCPVTGQLILKGIRDQGSTLIAETYVCTEAKFEQTVFWYFEKNGSGELRLSDWMSSQSMIPHSEFRAREFSASQHADDEPYDNYLAYDTSAIIEMGKEKAHAELIELAVKEYPLQLRAEVLTDFAIAAYAVSDYQLAEKFARRVQTSGRNMPRARWIELRAMADQKKFDEFEEAMDLYVADFGAEPRCWHQRSLTYYDADRPEDSVEAAIERLRRLPEVFDGALLEDATDEQMARTVEIIKPLPNATALSTSIVKALRSVSANKEALQLVDGLGISSDQSADAAALRGWAATAAGDFKKAATEYGIAIRNSEVPADKQRYVASWNEAMVRIGSAEEAIRTSPDPASSFARFVLGGSRYATELVVDSQTLARYRAVLEKVDEPADADAGERLRAWKPYAKTLEHAHLNQYEEAWESLGEAWEVFVGICSTKDDQSFTDLYPQKTLLARVATRIGKVPDAYKMLAEVDGVWFLCNECEHAAGSGPLKAFAEAHGAAHPDAAELKYLAGLQAEREGDMATARKLIHGYLKATLNEKDADDAPRRWLANSWLATDCVQTRSFEETVQAFDPQEYYEEVIELLQENNHLVDRERFINALASRQDFPPQILFELRSNYLQETWQWKELVRLYDDPAHETLDRAPRRLLEALVATKDFDRANRMLDDKPASYHGPWIKLQLAAAQGDLERAKKILGESPGQSGALTKPWLRETVAEWDEVFDEYPVRVTLPTVGAPECLLSSPATFSAESLTEDLEPHGLVSATQLGVVGSAALWNLKFSDSSVLLLVDSDRFHERDVEAYEITPQFADKLNQHRGWFALLDQSDEVAPLSQREKLMGQLVAALLNGTTKPECVACGYADEFYEYNRETFLDMLKSGQLDGFSRQAIDVDRRPVKPTMLLSLQDAESRLVKEPDGFELVLWWEPAGVPVALPCTVLGIRDEWNVNVRLHDSPLCPPWLRDREIVSELHLLREPKATP